MSDSTSDENKPLSRQDLLAVVVATSGLVKPKATEVLDAVLAAISGALKQGREVRLAQFGMFDVTKRPARTGRDPRTGEPIEIPTSTTVRFRPSKQFRSDLPAPAADGHSHGEDAASMG